MILLICMPFSMALSVEVSGVELIAEIGEVGDAKEFFTEGEFADFSLNVKYYEPTVLTTSTVEKANAPIFVHLWAIPAVPGMEVPRVQSMSIRESGTNVLAGSVKYFRPTYYTWNDFGYLMVNLKRIEKEKDVPNEIEANLTVKIRYETDVVPGLIAGSNIKTLEETPRETLMMDVTPRTVERKVKKFDLDRIQNTAEYRFFNGKGYIVAYSVKEGTDKTDGVASFILFDSRGDSRTVSVREGETSNVYSLVSGSKRAEDYVRIRVDKIEDKKVTITLLAGKKEGYVETSFKLHIPIEKRPEFLDLTPKKIGEQINKTDKLIKELDDVIEKVNNYVEDFYNICVGVTAAIIVGQFVGIWRAPGVDEKSKEALARAATKEAAKGTAEAIDEKVIRDDSCKNVEGKKKTVQVYASGSENVFLIPIPNPDKLPFTLDKLRKELNKPIYIKEKCNLYAVFTEKGRKKGGEIIFYIKRGSKEDLAKSIGDDEIDIFLTSCNEGESCYKDFKRAIGGIQNAQKRGRDVSFFGTNYDIKKGSKDILGKIGGAECEDVMSSKACRLLWNACDPVVCPPDRCDFGGRHKVKDVRQSGLLGSILLCLPNIRHSNGGVLVPICLTGIEASLRYLKTHLEGYKVCLKDKLEKGKSTGICDKMRSVFICRIVWKEIINLFGMIGSTPSDSTGPISSWQRSVQSSKGVTHFFIESYADEIFAAYKGRVSEEIGAEICKSAIAGEIPNVGKFVEEMARGGNPVQGTAWFEENVYSGTAGASTYFVYYHIYAGSNEQPVNYAIILRGGGADTRDLEIAKGVIKTGDFVDETTERVGPSGYQDICMIINGEARCGFGKMVSTSMAIEALSESYAAKTASKKINSERDCVPDYTGILGASVNRKCSRFKPDENWVNVGSCLKSGEEKTDIICWSKLNTDDKEIQKKIEESACGPAKVCNRNQDCIDVNDKKIPGTTITNSYNVCCEKGECVNKDFVRALGDLMIPHIDKIKVWEDKVGLSFPKDKELLDKWYDGGLKDTGDINNYFVGKGIRELINLKRNNVYYYIALRFYYDADYENARKIFSLISDEKEDKDKDGFCSVNREIDLKEFFEACGFEGGEPEKPKASVGDISELSIWKKLDSFVEKRSYDDYIKVARNEQFNSPNTFNAEKYGYYFYMLIKSYFELSKDVKLSEKEDRIMKDSALLQTKAFLRTHGTTNQYYTSVRIIELNIECDLGYRICDEFEKWQVIVGYENLKQQMAAIGFEFLEQIDRVFIFENTITGKRYKVELTADKDYTIISIPYFYLPLDILGVTPFEFETY